MSGEEGGDGRVEDLLFSANRVMMDILAGSLLAEGYGNVTLHQFRLLDTLRSGVTRPGGLARSLRVSPPSVTAMLERLEGMGLLVRTASPRDRRAVELMLTPEGKEMVRRVNARRRRELRRILERMDGAEVAGMAAGLRSFVEVHGSPGDGRGG